MKQPNTKISFTTSKKYMFCCIVSKISYGLSVVALTIPFQKWNKNNYNNNYYTFTDTEKIFKEKCHCPQNLESWNNILNFFILPSEKTCDLCKNS
jgi:hypothetical protein